MSKVFPGSGCCRQSKANSIPTPLQLVVLGTTLAQRQQAMELSPGSRVEAQRRRVSATRIGDWIDNEAKLVDCVFDASLVRQKKIEHNVVIKTLSSE